MLIAEARKSAQAVLSDDSAQPVGNQGRNLHTHRTTASIKGVAANNVFIYELEFGVTNTLGHHINSKENLMFLSIGIWHK